MRNDYQEKYTHPKLREKIKEQLKSSAKGGKKGKIKNHFNLPYKIICCTKKIYIRTNIFHLIIYVNYLIIRRLYLSFKKDDSNCKLLQKQFY